MKNRVTSDSGNPVNLFPFLAVLLCTMGALLVLLVVLAQRAGQRAVAEASMPTVVPQALPADSAETVKLVKKLAEVREYQQRLAELRKQADQRLLEEQQRLTHVEEHTRRLEHELARLSLAHEQLQATEQDQSVDQEQAERELARLQQLIKDTEARVEELREESQGKRSYAIVPYKGPNGTYRKPIYIECRKDAIILHPEGIHLKASDFADTSWPGNPLAAALRATRDHVNAQAAKAGMPEPPDPYPMILVRPDGIREYHMARAAIKSWDASYGYEFIESDWELNFPELPDPQIANVQHHAITLSRERLARLIRSAPRRFGGRGMGGSGSGGTGFGGTADSNGFGDGNADGEFASGAQLSQSQQGDSGSGTGSGTGSSTEKSEFDTTAANGSETQSGELQYGAMAGEPASAGGIGATGDSQAGTSDSDQGFAEAAGSGGVGDRYAQAAGSNGAGTSSEGSSGSASGSQASGDQGSSGGSAANGGATSGGSSAAGSQAESIADAQGRNWAVQNGSPNSVAIRRPIQIVVRQNQLALLPSRHATDGEAATGKVISLDQSMNEISKEFAAALRTRIEEWGLAGRGLYWKPVLKINVGPGGEQTAKQVLRLLKGSGVELSLPDTASAPRSRDAGGATNAIR